MNFSPKIYDRERSSHHRNSSHHEWTIVETVDAVLAVMLIVSPWTFRYSDTSAATWSAVVLGLLLGAVTATRVVDVGDWQGWASIALGACALLAPWILGFSEIKNAAGIHVTAGFVVLTMTLITFWVHYLDQPNSPA
ncbi:SPW repeat protein [Microvirga mediterraneensis]|uniref:SPW repeat protein n=1 Tax=Microvirga mediterraneensis TaxID=2754695 RepID=A0A838BW21_9HYPH|nr:SPW repeat protein [Microvirga mediterraneensis]MBA1159302.1 SPW repeat protein [Microvirga mediterraneensis]